MQMGIVIKTNNNGLFHVEKEKMLPIFKPAPIKAIMTINSEKYIRLMSLHNGSGQANGAPIAYNKNPKRIKMIGKLIFIILEIEGNHAIINVAKPNEASTR